MIIFDKHGNPQPEGLTNLTHTEFKATFVDAFQTSTTRKEIFEGYERYLADFQAQITSTFKNWVDGSFVTTKLNPGDIDLVNIIVYDEEISAKDYLFFKFLTVGGSKNTYEVDGYFVPVYPVSDPRYTLTEQSLNYWKDWFGHDRERRKKAIIELSIG